MIKAIEKKHLPQLIEIWNAHFEILTSSNIEHSSHSINKWFESRKEGNFEYLGYFEKKELLGFTIIENKPNNIWLKFIAVEETEKRKGIGSELVNHVVSSYEDKTIKTEVLEKNRSALEFFGKQGFQIEEYDEK